MSRRRLLLLGLGGAAVLVLGATLGWLFGTEAGARFVIGQAATRSPVRIETRGLSGTLAGPLGVDALRISAPAFEAQADGVELDWSPLALLAGRIRLVRLSSTRLSVETRGGGGGGAPSVPEIPFPVRLDDLRIDRLDVRADGRDLITDGRLALAGSASGRGLDLERVTLQAAEARVDGHARVSADAGETWSVILDWRLGPDGPGALSGRTVVDGTLARLNLAQSFQGLLAGRVEGQVLDLAHRPRGSLRIQLSPLNGPDGPWPAILEGASADLDVAGQLEALRVTGRVAAPRLAEGPVEVDWTGGWRDGAVVAEPLRLSFANGGRGRVAGRLSPAAGWPLEASLEAQGLGWPLGAEAPVVPVPELAASASGTTEGYGFEVGGTAGYDFLPVSRIDATGRWRGREIGFDTLRVVSPDGMLDVAGRGGLDFGAGGFAYRFDLEGGARLDPVPPVEGSVSGEGDADGVELAAARLAVLGGQVEGHGRLAWSPSRTTEFTATVRDLDPSGYRPWLRGRVSADLALAGGGPEAPGLEVAVTRLSGTLNGQALSGSGRVTLGGAGTRLSAVAARLGSARLSAQGSAGETLDLSGRLEIANLGEILPGGAGRIEATLSARGPAAHPVVTVTAEGRGLAAGDLQAETANLEADLDFSWKRPSSARVTAGGFGAPDQAPGNIAVRAEGTRGRHEIVLEASRDGLVVNAAATGGEASGAWSGEVGRLEVSDDAGSVLALEAPATLAVDRAGARLGEACLAGRIGRGCAVGEWRKGGPRQGRLGLEALDLEVLTSELGLPYFARGAVSGDIRLRSSETAFEALEGRIVIGEGAIFDPADPEVPVHAWRGGRLDLAGAPPAASARLAIDFGEAGALDGEMTLGWNDPVLPLEGQARLNLDALPILSEMLPDVTAITGRTHADLALAGTLRAPALTGSAILENGSAQVPALGLHPRDIQARAEIDGRRLTLTVSAESGGGRLAVDGQLDLQAEGDVEGRVRMTGSDVLLVNMPEARIHASPDLQFTYRGDELRIVGDVAIPRARLAGIVETGAVSPSPDEVIVGEVRSEGPAVVSRIRLTVGPDVTLDVRGLSGRLEGEILTIVDPPALPSGRGELRVLDGQFVVFGQTLDIERGALIYTGGPLEDPAIEISAVRQVADVKAGVRARGTYRQPSITLFSDPPMSRAETLSYLTTGKPISELGSGEDEYLSRAATSLALAGGSLVAGEVGERIGVDELGFEGDGASGGAALVIGKYLSPQLFVSYGVGLLEAVNVLRVRYRLSRRLSVEVASSDETSTDIIYTFDRN